MKNLPVTITTLPFTRGPVESGAIFLRIGMFSNKPWSGTGLTSCSLRAASLLLATAVIVKDLSRRRAGEEIELRTIFENGEGRTLGTAPQLKGWGAFLEPNSILGNLGVDST